jgi:hypothetical protein
MYNFFVTSPLFCNHLQLKKVPVKIIFNIRKKASYCINFDAASAPALAQGKKFDETPAAQA